MDPKQKFYIGLVGTNGSGKSAICDYLQKQKHFTVFSLSDIVRDAAKKRALALNRDNLVWTGNLLKSLMGASVLAKEVFQQAIRNDIQFAVFDSIRHIKEVEFLKSKAVLIIGVTAPIKIRYERICKRKKDTDFIDFETFKKQDKRENTGESAGQKIIEALDSCDETIENSGTLEKLYQQIDIFLAKY